MKPSWSDTLLAYLRASNEDAAIVSYFASTIPRLAERSPVSWLEIGPGPGSKTFGIYEKLVAAEIPIKRVEAIEPEIIWQKEFCTRARDFSHRFPRSRPFWLKNNSINDLARMTEETKASDEPNFITCIHVLYERNCIDSLIKYLSSRSNYVAYVVVEDQSSDFRVIRNILNHKFAVTVPLVAAAIIEKRLVQENFKYKKEIINGEICNVGSVADITEWLLPFILGITRTDVAMLGDINITGMNDFLRDYLTKKNWKLSIPDIAFVIEK